MQQEISRRTSHGQQAAAAISRGSTASDQLLLAILRKWFWARKPDAGFLLEGFPATLLQAKVLEDWIEARGETLSGVYTDGCLASDPVVAHYRTQGLLLEPARVAA